MNKGYYLIERSFEKMKNKLKLISKDFSIISFNIDGIKFKHEKCQNIFFINRKNFNKKRYNLNCPNKECHQEHIKNIFIEKYGVNNPAKNDNIKVKIFNTKLSKTDEEKLIIKNKFENTCLIRYGVKNVLQLKENRLKCTSKEVQLKKILTRRKNKTFNTSGIENKLYEYLISKYPNTKRNYKSDLYPFMCDFYIPEKDLYIELQAHWTHGLEPYNSRLKQHKEQLMFWKSKETRFYDEAIKTWTIRDVEKRKIAKENNLNYLEIFNISREREFVI